MAASSTHTPRLRAFSGLNARTAKRILIQKFHEAGLPFAADDAREIIEAATGFDRAALILQGTEALTPDIIQTLQSYMERRLAGEPVDHILGWREFFGRRFQISKDVLSPRADTETLIRDALTRLKSLPSPHILDLGTGSGAIGLTLLAERADATLLATDLSETALAIAKQNAAALNVMERANFSQGAWWDAVTATETFNLILSNPPYISDAAMAALETEVTHYDPDLALRGGKDGLDAYRAILSHAKSHLKPKGWLGLEIGFDQADQLMERLTQSGWSKISISKDLGGNDRCVWAYKSH